MNKEQLYDIGGKVWSDIQKIKTEREIETKAFIDGLEKGYSMMEAAVRRFLTNEEIEVNKK